MPEPLPEPQQLRSDHRPPADAEQIALSDLTKWEPKSDRAHREVQRDQVARVLAFGMLALFATTVLLPLVKWVWDGHVATEMISYTKDIAAIETAILAGIAGFYFSATRV